MSLTERIEVIVGDIAEAEAEAIVNAANEQLVGGGGVDGAIHKAAGPLLAEECRRLGGCPAGQARLTKGYNLKAKYVIHTVGPVWYGGHREEHRLLASCYRESLKIASDNKVATVAFPAISTGAYRFPPDLAALISVREIKRFLDHHRYPEKVIMVMYSKYDYDLLLKALNDEESAK
jgi:O-acetyl-ADP-ribose deacetylase (regulator of RNase III)